MVGCLARSILLQERVGQVVMRVGIIGHDVERALIRGDGFFDAPLGAERRPHVVVRGSVVEL